MKKNVSPLLCALAALLVLSGCMVRTDSQLPTDADALVLMEVYSVGNGYRATVTAAKFSEDGTSYTYSAENSYDIDLAAEGFAADLYVQEGMRQYRSARALCEAWERVEKDQVCDYVFDEEYCLAELHARPRSA